MSRTKKYLVQKISGIYNQIVKRSPTGEISSVYSPSDFYYKLIVNVPKGSQVADPVHNPATMAFKLPMEEEGDRDIVSYYLPTNGVWTVTVIINGTSYTKSTEYMTKLKCYYLVFDEE